MEEKIYEKFEKWLDHVDGVAKDINAMKDVYEQFKRGEFLFNMKYLTIGRNTIHCWSSNLDRAIESLSDWPNEHLYVEFRGSTGRCVFRRGVGRSIEKALLGSLPACKMSETA